MPLNFAEPKQLDKDKHHLWQRFDHKTTHGTWVGQIAAGQSRPGLLARPNFWAQLNFSAKMPIRLAFETHSQQDYWIVRLSFDNQQVPKRKP